MSRKFDKEPRKRGCLGRVFMFLVKTVIVVGVIAFALNYFGVFKNLNRTMNSIENNRSASSQTNSSSKSESAPQPTKVPANTATARPTATATKAITVTATPSPAEAAFVTLQRGDENDEVRKVQKRLIELNYLTGTADGEYGKKTETAVCDFQKAAGLPITGFVDYDTHEALFGSRAPAATPAPTPTPAPTKASGVRREVRDFADGYEKFMKDYVDFMTTEDPSSLTYILKYASMVSDYADWAQKVEDIDESDWTDEEIKYLADAEARVLKMLINAGMS